MVWIRRLTDCPPCADAAAEVLCDRQPLHHVCMGHFKDQEGQVEQPRQRAVLFSRQIGVLSDAHNRGEVYYTPSEGG